MQMKETPKEGLLLVRQTFLDREIEVFADVHIERISSSSSSPSSSSSSSSIFDGFENAPAPMTAEKVEDGLQSSSMFVAGATLMFCRWVKGFQSHVNELPLFDQKLSDRFPPFLSFFFLSFSFPTFRKTLLLTFYWYLIDKIVLEEILIFDIFTLIGD